MTPKTVISDRLRRHGTDRCAGFGLTDVVNPCITPLTRVHPFCSRPDEFLFWDGIHPTRAGHAIIAGRALEALNGP
jgi:phospholipase/lecithinase/hemolysin